MATKKTARRTTSAASRSTTARARRGTRSTAGTARRRRSQPGVPATIGTALGTVVVAMLLDLSWPARIGLIVAVVILGLVYILWKHRAEIAGEGALDQPTAPAPDGAGAPPSSPAG